jgi:hypothetical protein
VASVAVVVMSASSSNLDVMTKNEYTNDTRARYVRSQDAF